MFIIEKIDDMPMLEAFFKNQAVSLPKGMHQFMGVYENGQLLAVGSLELKQTKVYLNFIYCVQDTMLYRHALAKALLNMADLRDIQTIYGNNPELFGLYTALHFKPVEGEYILSLAGYFTATHE